MTYFYDRFFFDPGSRLTGFWTWRWPGDADADNVALVSHIRLGEMQDGELETNFLSSHLPWTYGGFHGVDPHGDPWLVVIQICPRNTAAKLVDAVDPWWPLIDGLDRALRFNRAAEHEADVALTREELVAAFTDEGIEAESIAYWTVPDLLAGLMAQFVPVPLATIVAGRLTGCALPEQEHECQYDVFRDVFAAWSQGLLTIPDEDPGIGGSNA